jgi:hypothetical protein
MLRAAARPRSHDGRPFAELTTTASGTSLARSFVAPPLVVAKGAALVLDAQDADHSYGDDADTEIHLDRPRVGSKKSGGTLSSSPRLGKAQISSRVRSVSRIPPLRILGPRVG